MTPWDNFRIRLHNSLSAVAMYIAPHKYRMWIQHVMEVGVQKTGYSPGPHGVGVYRGGASEPVLFEFATRAEAMAFARGYEAGSAATPEDLRRTAELQGSMDKPADITN